MKEKIPFGRRSTADDVLHGLELTGRTILITGCNSGIGFETFRALAAHGAHVIGLARTLRGAQDACRRAGGSSTPIECNLADLKSIANASKAVHELGRSIDAIVACAGIVGPKSLQIVGGVELQFFVNHLGHFALINDLVDLVPDRQGRIVIVSSSASVGQAPKQGILFENLDGHLFYKQFEFYGHSKLANALYAKELSRRLASRGIAVNSLHPGAIGGTGLFRSMGFPLSFILKIASLFFKTIPQGAATQTLLAASPLVQGVTGEYWADCNISTGSPHLNDVSMAGRLWAVSQDIVECSDESVVQRQCSESKRTSL